MLRLTLRAFARVPLTPRVVPHYAFTQQRHVVGFFGKAATRAAAAAGGVTGLGTFAAYQLDKLNNKVSSGFNWFGDKADQVSEYAKEFMKGFNTEGSEGTGDGGDGGDGGGSGGDTATAMGATAAAVSLANDEDELSKDPFAEPEDDDEETLIEDDEEPDFEHDETDDVIMNLSKQMIEIRNMLALINHDSIRLPLIVVVGSQSLGKSSVLEAIVGQEFLPKGNNMVTRRPIEMTLVNSPDAAAETADFPALKLYNITDFAQVQKQLYDLNMAVPMHECISPDPIQVTIRSPKVPDLSLVDLPGYIQVEAADQPAALKNKIREICTRYLEAPNIILAISAADVDLANSAALRAAKMADPQGHRTIGVVTKLDLVTPDRARAILTNRKYPLRMGYVGVITKAPLKPHTGYFGARKALGYKAYVAQQNFEYHYLKDHKDAFVGTTTSTRNLKKKLVKVLELLMAASLRPTYQALQQELEETLYQFKVEFNDRPLTPQMYLALNLDMLKLATKQLSQYFTRVELKLILKNELDLRVLDLMADKYWNDPEISHLSEVPGHAAKVLDATSLELTKLGVGRLLTTLATRAILQEVDNMMDTTQLKNHPLAKLAVLEAAKLVLSSKYYSTADQVENLIKPFKYEIEVEDREWLEARDHAQLLLKEELRQCDDRLAILKQEVGGRKLGQVMTYLNKLQGPRGTDDNEALGFSHALIQKGKEALALKQRALVLKMRYTFVGKRCKRKESKYQCPEVFLDTVTNKITQTAVLFLNVELLLDFYYNFPRELDDKFFTNLTKEDVEKFAKEDPRVAKHIDLQARKDLLTTALDRLDSVLAFQRARGQAPDEPEKKSKFSW